MIKLNCENSALPKNRIKLKKNFQKAKTNQEKRFAIHIIGKWLFSKIYKGLRNKRGRDEQCNRKADKALKAVNRQSKRDAKRTSTRYCVLADQIGKETHFGNNVSSSTQRNRQCRLSSRGSEFSLEPIRTQLAHIKRHAI